MIDKVMQSLFGSLLMSFLCDTQTDVAQDNAELSHATACVHIY